MDIIKKLSDVMGDVGAVGKDQRNQAQGFNFRGIDAVTNAVSPALRKHGVIVFPELNSIEYATIEVGKERKPQANVRVQVTYTFIAASDGSKVHATVAAEAMDSGDKATAKAMSVAFRIALLQTLCLPTDEPDPDHDTYERSPIVKDTAAKVTFPKQTTPQDIQKVVAAKQTKPATGGALTKANQVNITREITKKYAGEDVIVVVGDIINRTISSLDEVTFEESKVLLEKLFEVAE